MTEGRLQRAERIFGDALDLDGSERAAFIARECGGDDFLRAEVMALFDALEASEAYFSGEGLAVLGRVWDLAERDLDDGSLTELLLGPYVLEERVARGGMGSVYRARRSDGRFEASVAIKVLRRGLDTEDVVRRFQAERRILASLDHPNIARMFDAGETPDGRPYLVMEFVTGRPFHEYCDARELGIDERLELFAEVCRAVAFAHRHLVVHRDLKSTNILVTDEGGAGGPAVKLLDFGIAKVLDPGADADGTGLTRAGSRLLTPQYASPEQVAGGAVTTASDVYQLGLLLYEALCGTGPYTNEAGCRLDGAALEEAIRATDPPPPSRRVDATAARLRGVGIPALTGTLRGDLDAIVLKALRKDPDERYGSAYALADDVAAYRAGLPVAAMVGSRTYALRKLVRRHRVPVAASLVGVAVLAGWAGTATVQNRALELERDRVLQESARTGAIRDYLVGMFETSDPFRNETFSADSTSARELLDAGARRLASDLADQPLVRAELAYTIGKTYRALSMEDESRALLEEALTLQADAFGPESPQVAHTLYELGLLFRTIDADSAAALLDRALTLGEAALGPNDLFVAEVLSHLAEHLAFTTSRDTLRSRRLNERAVSILRARPDASRSQLADALRLSAYGLGGQMDLAIDRLAEALEIQRELYGDTHPNVGAALNDLSLALEAAGQAQRADSMMEAALDIYLATLGESHVTTLDIMGNLAGHYRDIRGEYEEAEALYERNIALLLEHRPDDRLGLAYPLYGLAVTLMRLGRFDEAEPKLRETHELLVESVGWASSLSFTTRKTLGECLRELGRLADAAAVLESSREGFGRAAEITVGTRLATLNELRRVYEAQGAADRLTAVDAEIVDLGSP